MASRNAAYSAWAPRSIATPYCGADLAQHGERLRVNRLGGIALGPRALTLSKHLGVERPVEFRVSRCRIAFLFRPRRAMSEISLAVHIP